MDANKLKKLQEVGYDIQPCCALCRYGTFGYGTNFGTCEKIQYDHLKHTDSERQLSINKHGCCHEFVADDDKAHVVLQNYHQFF